MDQVASFTSAFEALQPYFESVGVKVTRARLRLGYGLQDYVERTVKSIRKYRTFLSGNETIDLMVDYVPISLSCDGEELSDNEFLSQISERKHCVIQAKGGSGKSVFLKWLYIKLAHQNERVPLFLELRQLNGQDKPDIIGSIVKLINNENIDEGLLIYGMKRGKFSILLDGFDELQHSSRKDVSEQIRSICRMYPDCEVILTSRPGEQFENWAQFSVFESTPFTIDQIRKMINRANKFNQSVRAQFVRDITSHLYQEYRTFLETPLLCQMMFLTYNHTGDISKKLHLFYYDAYEAMFKLHDSKKDGFERELRTRLAIDDFADVFSFFSLRTYLRGDFRFDEDTLHREIEICISYFGLDVEAKFFIEDAVQGVCLLHKDGLQYTYTHRSFQEYFTASFLARHVGNNYAEIVDRIVIHRDLDDTVSLLSALDPAAFKEKWLLPTLRVFTNKYPAILTDEQVADFLNGIFGGVTFVSIQSSIHASAVPFLRPETEDFRKIRQISILYQEYFGKDGPITSGLRLDGNINEEFKSIIDGTLPASPSIQRACVSLRDKRDAIFMKLRRLEEAANDAAMERTEPDDDLEFELDDYRHRIEKEDIQPFAIDMGWLRPTSVGEMVMRTHRSIVKLENDITVETDDRTSDIDRLLAEL